MEKSILVNYTGRRGGGPIYAYEMTRGLLNLGCSVVAIISHDIENLSDWKSLPLKKLIIISTYSNKFDYLLNTAAFRFRQKRIIKRQINGMHFDAIYVPMICQWTSLINAIFPNIPTYETLHDPIPHSGEKWYLKKYKPTKATKKIIVLSEQFIEYAEKKYCRPVLWIPHGRFSYYKEKYFVKFRPSEKINFLFFGRLEEYKGLRILAEAFHKINIPADKYTLTIAGSGDWSIYANDFEKIPNLIVKNHWLSPKDINELYELANTVTILPYLDASQSGVIPVAQEYHSPIIASNTGGLREQIDDNVTGYLFETGNADDLAEKIKQVFNNFAKATELADNAYSRLSYYDWNKLVEKLIEDI